MSVDELFNRAQNIILSEKYHLDARKEAVRYLEVLAVIKSAKDQLKCLALKSGLTDQIETVAQGINDNVYHISEGICKLEAL